MVLFKDDVGSVPGRECAESVQISASFPALPFLCRRMLAVGV